MGAETIEVRYKEITFDSRLVTHKYIIRTDKDGDDCYARGGPESPKPTAFNSAGR